MRQRPFSVKRVSQHGAALVVVLILLLVMTLLGLASLRGTLMEERMSGSLYDRNLSFQAAEAALREAEVRIADGGLTIPTTATCLDGICGTPTASSADRWRDSGFNGWKATTGTFLKTATPQYFIEYMGIAPTWPGCDQLPEGERHPHCLKPRYRVTARSTAIDRAAVLLQTTYAGP
jgi:type IV pilus assembly protein PilX